MRQTTTYTVPLRRKQEGKTDYKKRLALLKSGKPRLVVRKSLGAISVQVIDFAEKGDRILVGCHSRMLRKFGWQYGANIPSAYLTGYLAGLQAKKAGVTSAVLDLGLNISRKGTLIYTAMKGFIDAGVSVPHNASMFPAEDRISGKHIAEYAKELHQKNKEAYQRQFSSYLKANLKIEELPLQFQQVKGQLEKGVR